MTPPYGPIASRSTAASPSVRWASTMEGHDREGLRRAHAGAAPRVEAGAPLRREEREELEVSALVAGATRAAGSGNRSREEEPDPYRTCFERDRDRILHSAAFRRLAGKTQVFVFPDDHQRTRLTHALEVTQVATAVARACRLNVALTEAVALGHDCGHGPGGHASEEALSPFVDGGYDHAVWGADVVLAPLNLCHETLDGVRNHSWSRPVPGTPEAAVVSWADRIAYCCHDLEDAHRAGLVDGADLPDVVVERCGRTRSSQLRAFIGALVSAIRDHGEVAMDDATAEALAQLRAFNYRHVYLRPDSVAQADAVMAMLRALVEHFAHHHERIPASAGPQTDDPYRRAVAWVGGMTDRFACRVALDIGWPASRLPQGVDTTLALR